MSRRSRSSCPHSWTAELQRDEALLCCAGSIMTRLLQRWTCITSGQACDARKSCRCAAIWCARHGGIERIGAGRGAHETMAALGSGGAIAASWGRGVVATSPRDGRCRSEQWSDCPPRARRPRRPAWKDRAAISGHRCFRHHSRCSQPQSRRAASTRLRRRSILACSLT